MRMSAATAATFVKAVFIEPLSSQEIDGHWHSTCA